MGDKNPAGQKLCLTFHDKPLWVFVTDLKVLSFEVPWLLLFVNANGLFQVDPELYSIVTSTMSSANPQHVMGCAEDFLIASFLNTDKVEPMCFDLFVEIEKFSTVSQRPFGDGLDIHCGSAKLARYEGTLHIFRLAGSRWWWQWW
jgi:hypothetical protein